LDEAEAVESPIGYLPRIEDVDLDESGVSAETLTELLQVDRELWLQETEGIEAFYAKFGDKLPKTLAAELETLKKNLG